MFYKALTEEILYLSVPKNMMVFNMMLALLFIFVLKFWYILPVNFAFYLLGVYVAKHDAQVFDCLQQYVNKKNYYCT